MDDLRGALTSGSFSRCIWFRNALISQTNSSMLKKILIARRRDHHRLRGRLALQPATYRVTRTAAHLRASGRRVRAVKPICINSPDWSPWAKIDPAGEEHQSKDHRPEPARFSPGWANKKVGEGRMTITESRTNDLIRMQA